jgi:ParB family chromosome partitioning protein
MKMRKLAPNIPVFANSKEFRDLEQRREGIQEPRHDGSVAESTSDAVTGRARRTQMIAIALIDPNPLAPRAVYTPEMIRNIAEDLRTEGQNDAIHVIPNLDEPGRYIICDGWTRVLACRNHKVMHELLAEVHEGMSLEVSAWFGYRQNEKRHQHCDLDRAMFYEKLIARGETPAEVARNAEISKTQLTFFRAYSKLPPDVLDIIQSNPTKFGANAAYQICKVYERAGVSKAVRLASRFSEEDHTLSWLVSQVQSVLETRPSKTTAPTRQIRYANGFFKQKGDAFEVKISVSPAMREKFAAGLEALLSTVAEADKSPADAASSDDAAEQ